MADLTSAQRAELERAITDPDAPLSPPLVRFLRDRLGDDPMVVSTLCTENVNGEGDPAWCGECPGCGHGCHGAAVHAALRGQEVTSGQS